MKKHSKTGSCHSSAVRPAARSNSSSGWKVALVGSPNVGKSAVFNRLTGAHATVSNYPGTTVDVLRGSINIDGEQMEIVDTPGMYSFFSLTGEERIARAIVMEENPNVIVNIVDALNLPRMLRLTLQLLEAGLPVILVLNMMDEVEKAGIQIDADLLARKLGIPVIESAAVLGRGIESLKQCVVSYVRERCVKVS